MRMQRREGPGSSGAQLQWDKERLALARPHAPCSLPSEGEVAEPQWGMRPGLLILLVTTLQGPCLGFARGAAFTGSTSVATALHLVCPARRLPGSEKLPPSSATPAPPQPRPSLSGSEKTCPQVHTFTEVSGEGTVQILPPPPPRRTSGIASGHRHEPSAQSWLCSSLAVQTVGPRPLQPQSRRDRGPTS